jgi:hypothetical protein
MRPEFRNRSLSGYDVVGNPSPAGGVRPGSLPGAGIKPRCSGPPGHQLPPTVVRDLAVGTLPARVINPG